MYTDKLKEIFIVVLENEPMSSHTSFKTGGNADIFIKADRAENIIKAVKILENENIPYFIMETALICLFQTRE